MSSIRSIDHPFEEAQVLERLAPEQLASYRRDGFLLLPKLFSDSEIELLTRRLAEARDALVRKRFYVMDSSGGHSELVAWSGDRDDLLGAWVRAARLLEAAKDLLDGRSAMHWHSKISFKAPGSEGRWDWHQDYGSWYREGCLKPDMLTATVALDESHAANGCLKLLRGSHHMGRLDHPCIGEASGADPEVLAEALERMEIVDCELAPGDCVLFHANTLHASGPNHSDRPRTLLHISYNAHDNWPFKAAPWHSPVALVALPDGGLGDASRWGPLDVDSLRRPERDPSERSIYGYRTIGADALADSAEPNA